MKIIDEPGVYLMWEGKLAQVVSIAVGKVIHFRIVEEAACKHCGHEKSYHIIENSPYFQEGVTEVTSVYDDGMK